MPGILVVDDSRFARGYLSGLLNEAGFETRECEPTSVFDLLSSLRAEPVDLLITDYEMPGCNGESLLRAIREDPVLKGLKVMMLTSHREGDLIKRLVSMGLDGFLIKGTGYREVVDRVGEVLKS